MRIGTWLAYHWPVLAGIAMVTISLYRRIYYSDTNLDVAFDFLAFISGLGFFGGWVDKLCFDATMREKGKRS